MHRLVHKGVAIEYRLLKTRQNRHMRLTVSSSTGVRVSAPRGCPETAMHALVREKADWILHKLGEYEEQRRNRPGITFQHGETVPLHGETLTLKVGRWNSRKGRVRLEAGELHLDLPSGINDSDRLVRPLCEAWLRNYARWYLTRRCTELAAGMGLSPTRIAVRRQTSKWGSCTAKGSISLNILLVCLPRAVCDYVLIHELAHLQELNHSRKFWQLVELHCPDYRQLRQTLRDHTWLLEAWDGDDA
ncbi:MAG: M48 family metallopeptidase [Bacteroidia bacterium]|nr:M48 family metallopeptidase [Bacteroidia bacterium]